MGFFAKHGRLLLPLGLAALGAIACYQVLPREARAVEILLVGFPDADVFGQRMRPLLLGLLFFLPAIAAVFYAFADSLDRYLVRRFLPLFALCLGALLMIWLLIDLGDNLADLRRSPNFIAATARFYVLQFPTIFVLIVPYALLLSLLYCLGRMSKSREIIAIIQTGRGMVRLVAPLLVASLFLSAACLIFNYHWAPWAEGYKDILLAQAKGARASQATNVLYYESSARRLWKVGEFPLDNTGVAPLLGVVVTQTHPDGRLKSRLISPQATWDRKSTQWTFENPVVEHFHCLPPESRRPGTGNPPPTFEKLSEPVVKSGWPETPWQLVKPGLPAAVLGIPELNSWLRTNRNTGWTADRLTYLTQWHYRWSQPFICLVIALLAAPLGIVFSRRGATGAVALAVFLCGGMIFVSNLSLALGEVGYLPPAVAAWLPDLLFGLVALYLFHRRMTGQPIYQTLRRMIPMED
jgi:LPS export ABC transporter permease LptG